MKKLVLILVISLAFTVNSFAGFSWSIQCTNFYSCVAEQGALKVYWTRAPVDQPYSFYYGKLTGVEGIPISIDDYQTMEKKIELVIEKSITRKKGGDIEVKANAPEGVGGPTAGTTGSKENIFTRKKSMAQSKMMGKKINVDYTLAFVEWLGDTRFGDSPGITKYWAASEYALDAYKRGAIESLIEMFFIARNADDIDAIAVDTKLTDENRGIVLTKYIGLTEYPAIGDVQLRYRHASNFAYNLSTASFTDQAVKITEAFKKDLEALKVLTKPNQTALKLYKKDKELAFAKWFGDAKVFEHIKDYKDRYIVALSLVRDTSENIKEWLTGFRAEFETAIKNKDQSVQIITVRSSPIPVIPIAVIAALLIGVVIFVKRKKKNNQQGGEIR